LREVPSRLARILRRGEFAVTTEVVPPRSADPSRVAEHARGLVGYADAVNVTDNPRASAHMSAVAGAAIVADLGLEPILQVTTRDRNRLALTSDLLGAWALGARAMLCLSGDPVADGDHPDAVEVRDLSLIELITLAARLRDEGRPFGGDPREEPPRFLVGVADAPLARPYEPARLEAKLDAGADFVQTQIAYDLDALREWADTVRARGITERAPVIVGLTPLRSARTARYIDEHLFGVSVPADVIAALEEAGPDAEARGVEMAIDLVRALRSIPGIAGVHVIGLGRDEVVRRVVEGADLLPRPVAAG
jgi:methylenetetrahydrofolate reductase (NADPH)